VLDINWQEVLGPVLSGSGVGGIVHAELGSLNAAIVQHSSRAVRLHPSIADRDLPFGSEPIPWFERGRWLSDNACRPGAFLNYAAGDYYIQDAGSMLALALCNVQPGEWVCDTCAAPGGKSSGLLEQLAGTGLVVSNEVIRSRLEILELTLARVGHPNYLVMNSEVEALAEGCSDSFDCVMVDAPCTGQSMVARGKQSLAAFSTKQIEHSAARQQRILRAAAQLVKPGGRLVYSTCTFAFAENEGMIDWFRGEHPSWGTETDPKLAAWATGDREGCYRLWPHRDRCAGAFAALLQRPEQSEALSEFSLAHSDFPLRQRFKTRSQAARYSSVEILPHDIPWLAVQDDKPIRLWQRGTELHSFPNCVPAAWVETSYAGVPIAELRGKDWQPNYASSIVELPELAPASKFELDGIQGAAYFTGAAIRLPPAVDAEGVRCAIPRSASPWVALSWRDRRLAWAKLTNGVLKNHLPKALRKPSLIQPPLPATEFSTLAASSQPPSP
jgi:16S rRNA C967 or C1407 C5-methylase (RsmB/RsmF family)/NOL1/NOP2/fmu family ribosome biogenesis protein